MVLGLTLPNVLLALKELIVVWINQIIYHNDIYEAEVFACKRSFDLIVYASRNPLLNSYIERLVDALLDILVCQTQLNYISIVIYDQIANKDKKRYSLKFQQFVDVSPVINGMSFVDYLKRGESEPTIDLPQFTWEEINAQFKHLLYQQINELERTKSKTSTSLPMKEDVFFKIVIDTEKDAGSASIQTSVDWVRQVPSPQNLQPIRTRYIPVAEVDTGILTFGLQNEYLR